MLQSVLSYLQGHGLAVFVLIFSFASLGLATVAQGFILLGKKVPGWLGTASTVVGNVLHFLNGNVAPALSSVSAPVVPPPAA